MSSRALNSFRVVLPSFSNPPSTLPSLAHPQLPLLTRRGRPNLTIMTDLPTYYHGEPSLPSLESPFPLSPSFLRDLENLLESPTAATASPLLREQLARLALFSSPSSPAEDSPQPSPQSPRSQQSQLSSHSSPEGSPLGSPQESLQESLASPIPLLLRSPATDIGFPPTTASTSSRFPNSPRPDSPYPHFGFSSSPVEYVYLPPFVRAPSSSNLSYLSSTLPRHPRRYPASPYPLPIRARGNLADFTIGPDSDSDDESCDDEYSDDEDGGVPLRNACTEWEDEVFYIE